MILDLNDSEKRYLYCIAFIVSTPAAHLMVCIECSRWILISFSLQYLKAIGNDKWKCQIDANLVHTNWYILYRHKYGNQYFIIPRVIIYYIISASIPTGCFLYLHGQKTFVAETIDGFLLGLIY